MLASMFAAFYWCINLGSATSMATIPIVLQISGSSLAFAIPGIFMAIALVIFLAGRNMYIMIGPETGAEKPASFRKVIWHCILHTGDRRPGQVKKSCLKIRFSKFPKQDSKKDSKNSEVDLCTS